MSALLAIDNVACARGGRLLFEGLSLTLEPGAAAVVTGPNGAGKSSLLRIAGGLLRPASGTVTRGSAALADDALALDMRLTLERALQYWAALDGGDAGAAMAAMAAVGLAHLSDVPVHMLSAGQRKRASLARVAAGKADLWLLDEPANGLDGEGLERLGALMAAHRAQGGAILAASHQPLGLDDAASVVLA